jgi:ribonuclease M5
MKRYLNAILVVEGKADAAYLSNYYASEIIAVNGYELAKQTLEYLKYKSVIILTDPDKAGIEIRAKLNEQLKNAVNVEIDIDQCLRGNKKGVAECMIDEIIKQLSPYENNKPLEEDKITTADLQKICLLNDTNLRNFICQKLRLGICNLKQLVKRLNYHKIELVTIAKLIEEYHGN